MEEIYLENYEVHYAYNCIHHFFDAFGIDHTAQYIESALKAATTQKVWKEEDPAGLLFFMEKLDALCTAVFAIHQSHALRQEAIIPAPEDGMPDMQLVENFHDRYFNNSTWTNFPRNLSAAQYHNPYKALKKFCNHMSAPAWKRFCKEVTDNALSRCIDDDFVLYDILGARRQLLRMTEACHLIMVRTSPKKKKAAARAAENIINEPDSQD